MADITDSLNAFRNAIRKELGLEKIPLNQRVAWFVRLSGDVREDTDPISISDGARSSRPI